MVWFVGVDVGGTFTDFFAFDMERGQERVFKTPSTPVPQRWSRMRVMTSETRRR